MAPAKATKKNAPSKSKTTRAKGKENAASTAARQAAKKKDQLRKGSGLGSRTASANTNTSPETSGAGGDSTTVLTAAEEIEQLKAEVLLLQKEKANALGHALGQRAEITAIPKPRGEAGSKGFKLIREMGLEDTAEHKQLYRSIMRSVRDSIIKRSIDLSLDFRKVDPDDLSAIFKWTRKMHPYMSKARFPQNWATAELVKQYMRNHRRYEVKKGRMMPRRQRSAATSSKNTSKLPSIDSDEDKDKRNDEDENEGGESNESDPEEDD